jgi:hypothetical protein
MNVRGIGEKSFLRLRSLVTVGMPDRTPAETTSKSVTAWGHNSPRCPSLPAPESVHTSFRTHNLERSPSSFWTRSKDQNKTPRRMVDRRDVGA